jgi:hypothetical protein
LRRFNRVVGIRRPPRGRLNPHPERSADEIMKWKKTFLTWEGFRLLFLAILGTETILCLRPVWNRLDVQDWMHMAVGAVILNILFLLGPAVETVLGLEGWKMVMLRCALFALGTCLCMLAVFFYIGGLHEIYLGRD